MYKHPVLGLLVLLLGITAPSIGSGATFIQGTVTANGSAVSNASVYLNCYNYSTYKYPYQYATTDSNGAFSMDTAGTKYSSYYYSSSYSDYGPCGTYYSGGSYTCAIQVYPPYGQYNVTSYKTSDFTPSCNSVRKETIALPLKDKKIKLTLTDGINVITSGITTYCYNQGGNYDYSNVTSASSDNIYTHSAVAGTYYCGGYCTNYSSCDYSGYPNVTVKLGANDTSVSGTLTFKANKSTLAVTVTNGTSSIANASVSAYSYGSGTSTYGTAYNDYVSVWGQTDANGAISLRVPAGTYTLSVWPPWQTSGNTYVSKTQEVTVGNAELKAISVVLQAKNSKINVAVVDGKGKAINGASISGWVNGGGSYDSFWGTTDSGGNYTAAVMEGLTYQVSAYYYPSSTSGSTNTNVCNYNLEGYQSVKAGASPVSISYTFPICDHTLSIKTVDSSGTQVTNANGWIEAKPTTQSKSDYYYAGVGTSLSSGAATLRVQSGAEYTVSLYMWDPTYVAGEDKRVTAGAADGSSDVQLTLETLDASIHGGYLDADGAPIADLMATYLYVYATKGKSYRSCTTTSTEFSCKVSSGDWCIGYWVDYNSGYVSTSPGTASTCHTITAGQSVAKNLTLLKTGEILVTVLNPVAAPQQSVWVEAKATSVGDYGKTDNYYYYGQGCMTNSEGKCTIAVGAAAAGTTYYVNAYTPYGIIKENNWTQPDEQKVTVTQGADVEVSLSFGHPDGSAVIALAEAAASISAPIKAVTKAAGESVSIIEGATVDIFSNSGAYATGTTDADGQVTLNCTVADTWYAVAYHVISNALYMSESTQVSCGKEAKESAVGIKQVATIPECQSKTVNAGTASTFECTDGFSVAFPANSLATSGTNVSVTVAATVTPFMANLRPASFYGYAVNATKSDTGESIIALNGDATLIVPCNASQLDAVGLEETDLEACYYDNSQGAYKAVGNNVINAKSCIVTMSVDHLTDFVVAGNGNLKGLDGTPGGVEPTGTGETGGSGATGGCGCRTAPGPVPWSAALGGLLSVLPLLLLFGFRGWRRRAHGEK